jgi:hypothetical protein
MCSVLCGVARRWRHCAPLPTTPPFHLPPPFSLLVTLPGGGLVVIRVGLCILLSMSLFIPRRGCLSITLSCNLFCCLVFLWFVNAAGGCAVARSGCRCGFVRVMVCWWCGFAGRRQPTPAVLRVGSPYSVRSVLRRTAGRAFSLCRRDVFTGRFGVRTPGVPGDVGVAFHRSTAALLPSSWISG